MPPQSRLNDKAQCPSCSHGKPCCSHPTIGPTKSGSPNININGLKAIRLGDPGVHDDSTCCGPNTYIVAMGSSTVFFNDIPASRIGDQTTHCGGVGALIEGSENVMVGG